jgi:hypothetical protein
MRKRSFTTALIVLFISLFSSDSFAQKNSEVGSQPAPVSFKRNNGNSTCGQAEIKVFFDALPQWLPAIEEIRSDATAVTGIVINDIDASQLANKGYVKYCISSSDVIPAGKLWIRFHYLQTDQIFWVTETHLFKN